MDITGVPTVTPHMTLKEQNVFCLCQVQRADRLTNNKHGCLPSLLPKHDQQVVSLCTTLMDCWVLLMGFISAALTEGEVRYDSMKGVNHYIGSMRYEGNIQQ